MIKTIKTYDAYNQRRYSKPWVCEMKEDGSYDFDKKVGTFDGTDDGGDLVVFDPEEGKVYGYGQKDYRGNRTEIEFVKVINGEFVPCSKLGRLI